MDMRTLIVYRVGGDTMVSLSDRDYLDTPGLA